MATRYKVLGQVAPSATTATSLYTVPSLKEAVISTIVVANRAGTSSFYRIAIRPAAATLADQHYIAYDVVVDGNDSTTLTLGITITATDVVTIYSSSTNLTFAAFGSEIDL
jgi:hypothetical protein